MLGLTSLLFSVLAKACIASYSLASGVWSISAGNVSSRAALARMAGGESKRGSWPSSSSSSGSGLIRGFSSLLGLRRERFEAGAADG